MMNSLNYEKSQEKEKERIIIIIIKQIQRM